MIFFVPYFLIINFFLGTILFVYANDTIANRPAEPVQPQAFSLINIIKHQMN